MKRTIHTKLFTALLEHGKFRAEHYPQSLVFDPESLLNNVAQEVLVICFFHGIVIFLSEILVTN